MERTGIHSGYQDIREAAAREEQLPSINVTEQVMARVRGMEQVRSGRGISFAGRTAATSGLLVLLLLITVTAYAASEYIQIRNKEGVVKVQHLAESQMPQGGGISSYSKYEQKLMNFAEPGEQIVYYVRGEPISEGTGSLLQFAYKEQKITDYSAFLKQMETKHSPVILPETAGGYAFKYGKVNPLYPPKAERDSNPVYSQALHELIGEAKQDKKRNLFMKILPWTETGYVSAEYTKQGAIVGISAYLMNGGNMTVYQQPEQQAEKLEVDGRELIYNHVVRPEVVTYHYLNWYNEGQDTYFMLTTYGDRALTKEQLLKLAGELMKGGL
ncbi:hypothetical protein [Paenibacillus ihuae]|uniref:hypothetical protein n=1 Tax=Paenibacillus ihuae TaxID=1232431 RepID=UPI0006D57E08|nr:hypothetical protein [Paenibacillus ihuae]